MHQTILIPSPGDTRVALRLSENISNFTEGKNHSKSLTERVRT